MPTRSDIFDENPALDGPDYVALVLEWDELADDLERQLRDESSSLIAEAKPSHWSRTIKIAAAAIGAIGAIGAIALLWGIGRRLRG
jgi:preprotein translocase subunit Sss1